MCGPKKSPKHKNINMETQTIQVVTIPVGDLLSMISNTVNSEFEKLVNNPRLGEGFKDELWDRKQASSFLGVSEQTLTKVYREGKIRGQQSGRKYHFLKSSVIEFLNGRNS